MQVSLLGLGHAIRSHTWNGIMSVSHMDPIHVQGIRRSASAHRQMWRHRQSLAYWQDDDRLIAFHFPYKGYFQAFCQGFIKLNSIWFLSPPPYVWFSLIRPLTLNNSLKFYEFTINLSLSFVTLSYYQTLGFYSRLPGGKRKIFNIINLCKLFTLRC